MKKKKRWKNEEGYEEKWGQEKIEREIDEEKQKGRMKKYKKNIKSRKNLKKKQNKNI